MQRPLLQITAPCGDATRKMVTQSMTALFLMGRIMQGLPEVYSLTSPLALFASEEPSSPWRSHPGTSWVSESKKKDKQKIIHKLNEVTQ